MLVWQKSLVGIPAAKAKKGVQIFVDLLNSCNVAMAIATESTLTFGLSTKSSETKLKVSRNALGDIAGMIVQESLVHPTLLKECRTIVDSAGRGQRK